MRVLPSKTSEHGVNRVRAGRIGICCYSPYEPDRSQNESNICTT